MSFLNRNTSSKECRIQFSLYIDPADRSRACVTSHGNQLTFALPHRGDMYVMACCYASYISDGALTFIRKDGFTEPIPNTWDPERWLFEHEPSPLERATMELDKGTRRAEEALSGASSITPPLTSWERKILKRRRDLGYMLRNSLHVNHKSHTEYVELTPSYIRQRSRGFMLLISLIASAGLLGFVLGWVLWKVWG